MEIAELYQKGLELDAEAERLEESGRKDPAVNCQTTYQKAAVLRKEAACCGNKPLNKVTLMPSIGWPSISIMERKTIRLFTGAKWLPNRDCPWRSTHWGVIIVVWG